MPTDVPDVPEVSIVKPSLRERIQQRRVSQEAPSAHMQHVCSDTDAGTREHKALGQQLNFKWRLLFNPNSHRCANKPKAKSATFAMSKSANLGSVAK